LDIPLPYSRGSVYDFPIPYSRGFEKSLLVLIIRMMVCSLEPDTTLWVECRWKGNSP
jgi:hypothetical protein